MMNYFLSIVLTFALAFSILEVSGQTFDYFENDPVWKVSVSYPPDVATSYSLIYYINGDSLLNGMVYHKVYERSYIPDINEPEFDGFRMLVRQQERQVYLKQNGQLEELLDDYSGDVGDSYWRTGNVITSIDSVEINGQYHRKIKDNSGAESIEGIGYYDSPLFHDQTPISPPDYRLGCYGQFGESITVYFEDEDNFPFIPTYDDCDFEIDFTFSVNEQELSEKISVYPNPTSDHLFIEFPQGLSSSRKYILTLRNPQGKLLKTRAVSTSESIISLDLSQYPKGLHLVNIETNGKVIWSERVILE